MIEIVEKYFTLGGEAPLIGIPVYIIRFTGCNLECNYCDTDYKDEVNFKLNQSDLIDEIKKAHEAYPNAKILFTGGEPLLNSRKKLLYEVMKILKKINFYIETNGTINLSGLLLRHQIFGFRISGPLIIVFLYS